MKEVQYNKGDVIFREGEGGKSFYQILDGKVGIYAMYGEEGETCLTSLSKDDYFGEMAVIEAYPRSATAVAAEDVKVMELSTGEIDDFFRSNPEKILEIIRHLCKRLKELTDDYSEVEQVLKDMESTEESKRSEGLISKIKKFARVYRFNRKAAEMASVESLKKPEQKAHDEGFSGEVSKFAKGTIIFKEGEPGECMYDIHFGRVGIFMGYGTPSEKKLTDLYANDFFGEMGMIGGDKRSATAVVLDNDTIVEVIYPSGLKELFEKNPLKVDMVLRHVSYRLRKLTNDYLTSCKKVNESCSE